MYTSLSTAAGEGLEGRRRAEPGPGSATDAVYASLRSDIRAGCVYPWDRLTEKSIGEHFGVSRTPVRKAMARLVAEGLLQRHSNGFGLVLPDAETIAGLYEARLAIERQGIRRVSDGAAQYDMDHLGRLREKWEAVVAEPPAAEPWLTSWDEEFHRGVLAAAGEPALVDVLSHINDRIRALRMYGYISNDQVASSAAAHLTIVNLLAEGRLADGESALAEHIISTRNDSLARALQGSDAAGFTRRRTPLHTT